VWLLNAVPRPMSAIRFLLHGPVRYQWHLSLVKAVWSGSFFFAILFVSVAFPVASAAVYRLSPMILRYNAQKIATPRYPKESLAAQHSGLVVAAVEVSERGTVSSVKLLQTVDPAISTEVIYTLRQWIFRPAKVRGQATACNGRLIFYFKIVSGKGVVIDAVDEQLKRSGYR